MLDLKKIIPFTEPRRISFDRLTKPRDVKLDSRDDMHNALVFVPACDLRVIEEDVLQRRCG